MIVDKTRHYAEQVLQGTDKVWSTPKEEIHTYMGFMILMGINHLLEKRNYRSVCEYFRHAQIADRISRERFKEITRFLHLVKNDSLPARGGEGYSRFQKVDPVISALKTNFQSAYYPHCELSIDEVMIPFQRRSSMKQYIPLKPVKRGFKVWAMADARNGYMYYFNVYTGVTGNRKISMGEKVVLTLAEYVKGRHHQLYFDNYFTSIYLLTKLLSEVTYGCGTIRTNRKQHPSEIQPSVRVEIWLLQPGKITKVVNIEI